MAQDKKKTPEEEKKEKRKGSALRRFILGKTRAKPIIGAIEGARAKAAKEREAQIKKDPNKKEK